MKLNYQIMYVNSKNHPDHITVIAVRLADHFVKPLYEFNKERNYFVYVGCLSEILDWSAEFYKQYNHKLNNWEDFVKSKDNIYDAVSEENFLISWGNDRIKKFYAQYRK